MPSWNPFFALRGMWRNFDIRPVPVVRRRFAFTLQLNRRIFADGYPQEAQRCFWMWKDTFPHRRHLRERREEEGRGAV